MRSSITEAIEIARAADRRLAEESAQQAARSLADRSERDRETARRLSLYIDELQNGS